MHFCFTQSPRESNPEAEQEALPEPGVIGKLVLTFCSHTIKRFSARQQLPLGAPKSWGRWWGEQPALLLLCSWTPKKCRMTLILWTGQFRHLFQITEPKLSNPWCIHLFLDLVSWGAFHRDAPSTFWVCMGLSSIPNPFKPWNTLQNNTLNLLFSSSSKSRAISAYWEQGCSQINMVFLYSEQATLLRYDVPRNGSRLFKIENLWTFSLYLCSTVNKCLIWLLLNVVFLEWK